jgi:hypothetical protein
MILQNREEMRRMNISLEVRRNRLEMVSLGSG